MPNPSRRASIVAASVATGALLLAAVSVPALGKAGPGGSPATAAPAASDKPGTGPKTHEEKVRQSPVTLTGSVATRTDADGETQYTLTVGSTVYDLEVGPAWFWGENHPLKGLVGKTVTIEGDQAEGSTSVDVRVADGKTLREPGRPPWAGGWKAVGKTHPGWSQAKADRQAAKGEHGTGRPSWAGPKTPDASEDAQD